MNDTPVIPSIFLTPIENAMQAMAYTPQTDAHAHVYKPKIRQGIEVHFRPGRNDLHEWVIMSFPIERLDKPNALLMSSLLMLSNHALICEVEQPVHLVLNPHSGHLELSLQLQDALITSTEFTAYVKSMVNAIGTIRKNLDTQTREFTEQMTGS
ncbi:MAG: hypothetical protein ACK5NY_00970 [Burkholderiaceae bacterium]|jgi:hypothetical protein